MMKATIHTDYAAFGAAALRSDETASTIEQRCRAAADGRVLVSRNTKGRSRRGAVMIDDADKADELTASVGRLR